MRKEKAGFSMNTISFTPNITNFNSVKLNKNNTPSFSGLSKKPSAAEAKKAGNFIQNMYQKLFLRGQGNIKSINNGYVYTENFSNNGAIRTSKKFRLWSRKPQMVVKDNNVTAIREKSVINKDGSVNLDIRDMYTPDYRVSAGYSHVVDGKDNGNLRLAYGDKVVDISKEKREGLHEEFNKILDEKFPESLKELTQMSHEQFRQYASDFYKTPEAIATSILDSPASLQEQLKTVPRSLPYGIECILDKIEK